MNLRTASLNSKFTGSNEKKGVLPQIVELIKSWQSIEKTSKKSKTHYNQ